MHVTKVHGMFINMSSLGSSLFKQWFRRPEFSSNKYSGKQTRKRPKAVSI